MIAPEPGFVVELGFAKVKTEFSVSPMRFVQSDESNAFNVPSNPSFDFKLVVNNNYCWVYYRRLCLK
ncbi:MAG: hypothetical protein KF812_05800 [Fimbriimonadaceae bacterium]|nr:hypothetical protein [Fimbriimonadaceae bacterium]